MRRRWTRRFRIRIVYRRVSLRGRMLEFRRLKAGALEFVKRKIGEINRHYSFKFGRITIRNQKSRWGSCSKKGNLNFHYKILKLPEPLADYLVAHELCHLGEFNHSRKFWELVAKAIPDFRARRREMKNIV